MKRVYYSVVIPAHNESENLRKLVKGIHETLKKTRKSFEIIIVNDNSSDNSYSVLSSLKRSIKCLNIIDRKTDPGVGYAIREGLAAARGSIIITLDGDLSHDPKEIPLLLSKLDGFDMVCGSRYVGEGAKAEMPMSRKVISGLFNVLFRRIVGLPVKDFTSGFRVYRRAVIDKIKLTSNKFGIYIEIPIKAYLHGFKITETQATYHRRGEGKSNLNYMSHGPEYLSVILSAIRIKYFK